MPSNVFRPTIEDSLLGVGVLQVVQVAVHHKVPLVVLLEVLLVVLPLPSVRIVPMVHVVVQSVVPQVAFPIHLGVLLARLGWEVLLPY